MTCTPSELARAAYAQLQEHGHTKGRFQDPQGAMCLVGAIEVSRRALGAAATWEPFAQLHHELRLRTGQHLAEWNDAPERTQADVEKLLLRTADELDFAE